MFSFLKDIVHHRELLRMLVHRNLKIRYKQTMLGFFWTLLGPLMLILIYSVFARIMRWHESMPNFTEYLIVGIVVWQFLVMCLNDSLHAIMGNANLVKKTAFPRIILPLSMVTANLINFLLTSAVLVIYLMVIRADFSYLYVIPLVILTQTALCLGMALLLSTSNVFFRDTEHILSIVTLAWFFLSPIFYKIGMQLDMLSARSIPAWPAFLNPMAGLLCAYRAILLSDMTASLAQMALSFAVSWGVLVIGILVFQKTQVRFGDEL